VITTNNSAIIVRAIRSLGVKDNWLS